MRKIYIIFFMLVIKFGFSQSNLYVLSKTPTILNNSCGSYFELSSSFYISHSTGMYSVATDQINIILDYQEGYNDDPSFGCGGPCGYYSEYCDGEEVNVTLFPFDTLNRSYSGPSTICSADMEAGTCLPIDYSAVLIPQLLQPTDNTRCKINNLFPQYQDGQNHSVNGLVWKYYNNANQYVPIPNYSNRYPLNVSIQDIFGANYQSFFTGSLQLQFTFTAPFTTNTVLSNQVTFQVINCSPQLLNFTSIDTQCSYTQDGSFSMILDNNLNTNEKLVVSLFYEFVAGSNNYSLLTQNDTINLIDNGNGTYTYNWPNQIFAGNYKVKYQTFDISTPNPVWNSLEGTESGFTIGNPPPIFISGTSQNVNCFNGSDGTIQLNASGGVGSFKYEINGNNNWIPFSNPNTHTISNNTQGVYNIKIKDANGCTEQQ